MVYGTLPQFIRGRRGRGFGIANMGSGVIRVIEMILWRVERGGHDSDGWGYGELQSDLILNQFSHPAISRNSLT